MVDTSVLLRFFHDHRDTEQPAADRIERAFREGQIGLVLLDLSIYEFTNVLVKKLRLSPEEARIYVGKLYDLEAPIHAVSRDLAERAAEIAVRTGLSGYDAAFVAASVILVLPLLTADRALKLRASEFEVVHLADLAS